MPKLDKIKVQVSPIMGNYIKWLQFFIFIFFTILNSNPSCTYQSNDTTRAYIYCHFTILCSWRPQNSKVYIMLSAHTSVSHKSPPLCVVVRVGASCSHAIVPALSPQNLASPSTNKHLSNTPFYFIPLTQGYKYSKILFPSVINSKHKPNTLHHKSESLTTTINT